MCALHGTGGAGALARSLYQQYDTREREMKGEAGGGYIERAVSQSSRRGYSKSARTQKRKQKKIKETREE